MGNLTSTLSIRVDDAGVAAKLKADGDAFRKFGEAAKGIKGSAELERLNRQLGEAQKGLAAIDKVRNAQANAATSRMALAGPAADAARVRKELEAARAHAAQYDGVKAFSKTSAIGQEIEAARKAVRDLEKADTAAQRSVERLSGAVKRQEKVAADARQELNRMGVPFETLSKHQDALRRTVTQTTGEIERQTKAHRDHARAQAEAERFSRDRAANIARNNAAAARAQAGGGGGLGAGIGGSAGMVGAAGRFGAAAAGIGGGAYIVGDQLRRAAKSSMDFERALIEVGKATDTKGAELDAYGEKLMALARATGKTKEDLASVLSQAGFAGRPKAELMDFTEYAAKATVAWQTSAEETGQAMAEIGNIYEANQKRIEEIGDAINTMADNSASRETDLLEFMRRAGASSREAGISAEHMLAFGAAMKEVGVRNEVAATGFEALLNVMKLGKEFSKSAGKGLEALGVNSTKMRKAFVAKPVETMIGLLQKLSGVTDPLKKAEIMTNLFGKEYQDDIAKLLNALPKLTQNLALMSDKAKIAAGGVRFQFAENLDKDVSKIDRATQAIDVLYKRIGDPIKVGVGGVADEINKMVDKLESGDSILQRLIARLTGIDGSEKVELELPKVDGEKTAEEWAEENVPWLSGKKWNDWINEKLGKTGKEARQKYLDDRAREQAGRDQATLDRPGEVEEQIRRRQALLDRARERAGGAPGIQRDMARDQVGKSEAEIARLQGELAKAWDEVGRLRLQQKRERGDFGMNEQGFQGKGDGGIQPGSFGFGMNGTQNYAPRNVPLPPARPDIDTGPLDTFGEKTDEAKQKLSELGAASAAPTVDASSIASAVGLVEQLLAKLGQVGGAAASAQAQVANLASAAAGVSSGRFRQRPSDNYATG